MPKNWKLIHIKSKQHGNSVDSPKLPTREQLEYGEIAINYGDGIETIAIKNDKDEIVKFIPERKIDEMIETRIKQVIPEIVKQVILSGKTDYQYHDNDIDSIDSGEY